MHMVKSGTNIEIPKFDEVYSSLSCNDLGRAGFYDYGFRDYAPELGRFTTVDPIKDGSNWYAYVGNDPVNLIDLWGLLTGNNEDFLQTQQDLLDTDYIWAGNDPVTDGGVDCSGGILHGLDELGNDLEDMTADEIHDNLTSPVEGDPQPGDLRFLDSNNDGVYEHVQTISSTDGDRINASGDPTNTADNPGVIEELPGPLPASGEIRRLDWDPEVESELDDSIKNS